MTGVATTPRFLAAVPALPVPDERRAVAFLEKVLGFTRVARMGQGLGDRDDPDQGINRRDD